MPSEASQAFDAPSGSASTTLYVRQAKTVRDNFVHACLALAREHLGFGGDDTTLHHLISYHYDLKAISDALDKMQAAYDKALTAIGVEATRKGQRSQVRIIQIHGELEWISLRMSETFGYYTAAEGFRFVETSTEPVGPPSSVVFIDPRSDAQETSHVATNGAETGYAG